MIDYGVAYRALHQNDKRFSGNSILKYADAIAELVREHGAKRLLDYGSGKGYQYLATRIHERWGGVLPYCYDVGVRQLATCPTGMFDGIICTDVMEHIEEGDIGDILGHIFWNALPTGFVFFGISCIPSRAKVLPDGRNVHLTVRPPEWWARRLLKVAGPEHHVVAVFDPCDDRADRLSAVATWKHYPAQGI